MRYILILLFLIFLTAPSFAINWVEIKAPNGSYASLDTDSIKEEKNYYFYNIKIVNLYTNETIVVTMQSGIRSALSARINFYKLKQYEALNGDYEHILDKYTRSLEPVEYGSIVYACYSKVKSLMQQAQIQF
ncbi:hypothetical protein IJ531_02705 [bacterium]|nr:hypothetical protein [bacterium]